MTITGKKSRNSDHTSILLFLIWNGAFHRVIYRETSTIYTWMFERKEKSLTIRCICMYTLHCCTVLRKKLTQEYTRIYCFVKVKWMSEKNKKKTIIQYTSIVYLYTLCKQIFEDRQKRSVSTKKTDQIADEKTIT